MILLLWTVYTGDFCRETQWNFARAKFASSFKQVRDFGEIAANDIEVATQSAIALSCAKKVVYLQRSK